jgi:UPF0716 protein FxsA
MIWVLAVLLLVLPWLEIWLINSLGIALPVMVVQAVATAGVGWWYSRQEELSLWSELESDIQNHRVPTEEGLDAMLTVLGGWGLIIPGWITDLAGAVLLVPAMRAILIRPIRGAIRDHLI